MELALRCAVAVLSIYVIWGTPGSDGASSKECLVTVTARNDSHAECNIEHCSLCTEPSTAHDMTCDTCQSGYGVSGNGKVCVKCSLIDTDCVSCVDADNNGVPECTECTTDHSVIRGGTACLDCRSTVSNCVTCADADEDGVTECLSCDTGFWPTTSGGVCMDCDADIGINGCIECTDTDSDTSADECNDCASGFVLTAASGICLECSNTIANCETCLEDANAVDSCTLCAPGFSLNGGANDVCMDCEDDVFTNCFTCTDAQNNDDVADRCDSCVAGYMLADGAGSCIPCSLKFERCLVCADSDTGVNADDVPDECSVCEPQTVLHSGGLGCIPCNTMDNCLDCTDVDGNNIVECTECIDGYIPRADGSACYRPDGVNYESSIELNGKTIFTDYHVYGDITPLEGDNPGQELILIPISPDCDVYFPWFSNRDMKQFLHTSSSLSADDFIIIIEDFIWEVPYGTYLAGIYISGSRANDDEFTQTMLQTLRSLGAPINSTGEAEEDLFRLGDGDYSNGVTLLFVGRKGMPQYGVGKYMHDLPGERVLENYIHLDLSGVSPLPSSDIVWSVPMYPDVNIDSILDKTYIAHTDVFRHDGHVYGWEFIAADRGRCLTPEELASFGLWRRESRHSNTTNLIHRTTLNTSMPFFTEDIGTIQYMCEASPVDVKLGDMYGIIVNDECLPVQANLCDDLSQVPVGTRLDDLDVLRWNTLFYCQGIEPYPCGRVGTQYDREWHWMTDTDWSLNQGANVAVDLENIDFPDAMPTLFAFRPITDPGFLYTCGCMVDSDCHMKGDRNMVCDDMQCKCAEGFMYHRKTNRCVRDMAHGHTAWQSTTYKEYTAELALDNNTATDDLETCSMTQNMYDPNDNTLNSEKNKFPTYFVVDLGAEALVGAVTLTPPDTIKSYVVLYYPTNTHDVHTTTGPITPGYVRVIVYGFGFWKIYTGSTYTGDSVVLRGPGVFGFDTAMHTVGSLGVVIKRLDVYYLYANDEFCLYEDTTTELKVTADKSECRLFYYDADDSRSIHIWPSDINFNTACTNQCAVTIGGSSSTATTDDNQDVIKLNEGNVCLKVEFMSEGAKIRSYEYADEELDCTTFTRTRAVEDYPLINAFSIQERDWGNPNDNGENDEDASYTFTAVNVPDGLQDICIEWTTEEEELANVTYVYLHQKYGNEFLVNVIGKNLEGTASFRDDFGFEQVYFFSPKHLHNFEIVVTNDVEEFGFVSGVHDQRCATFTGNIAPGHTHTIDCDKPVYGRYVALVSLYPIRESTKFHGFSLCDIQVQGLPVVLHGSSCTYNRDCRITDDYPMYCNDGVCDCLDGFHFSATAGICIDTNECLVNYPNTSICEYYCYNYDGGYECGCPYGYKNSPDAELGPECENINECLVENGDCAQICVDEEGDYHCECQPGWMLTNDTGTCVDVDECSHPDLHQCDEELTGRAICDNLLGSYTCWCPFMSWGVEYNPVDNTCLDVSFCEYKNGGCHHICIPSDGDDRYSVTCECEEGYYLSDNTKSCIDIDECSLSPPVCGLVGTCHNHVGHYECECPAGYMFNNGTGDCEDMDECDYINTPPEYKALCEHKCTNTNGWYECSCDEGYDLRDDDYTCFDIDECLIPATCGRDDGRPEICTNTIGSYICSCKGGYRYNEGRRVCEDINECSDNNGECEHTCKNNFPGYECVCRDGYELQKNLHGCWKIDQCKDDDDNDCTQLCREIVDTDQYIEGYECSCKAGYEIDDRDRISCHDVNECTEYYYYGHCEGTCRNTNGSYICGCESGFILNDNKHSCDDVNECAGRPCEEMCVNTYGSFECQCPTGFRLRDRYSCEDINECTEDSHHCSHGCANTRGSYQCTCPDGYILLANNWICADENECERVPSICDVTETCVNYLGSYECQCPDGMYRRNEYSECIDMNECEDHNGGCHHMCTNLVSSYVCSCHPGYELSSNKHSCIDTDECMVSNGGCKHKCVNEPGSYRCMCNYGYVMSVDGTDCLSLDRRVLMQLVLDMSWLDEYHDARSAETRELIREIEQQMFIITDAMLNQFGLLRFTVVQLFRGSVGMILSASFSGEVSIDDESEIRFLINQAIQEHDRTLNVYGRRVHLIGTVEMAYYNQDGSLQTGLVGDMCDEFRRLDYCKNDGECEIDSNGKPHCECPSGYSGSRCEDTMILTDTEIAFVVIIVVLFIIVIVIFVLMCVFYTRLQAKVHQNTETIEDKDSYSNQFYPRNFYQKTPWIWSTTE